MTMTKTFADLPAGVAFSWAATDMGAIYVKTGPSGYQEVLPDGDLGTRHCVSTTARARFVRTHPTITVTNDDEPSSVLAAHALPPTPSAPDHPKDPR
jgi:hypothetical protein